MRVSTSYYPYFDVYTNIQNPIDCRPSDYIVHVFVVRGINNYIKHWMNNVRAN